MEEVLRSGEEETPYLLVDLDIVRDRFQQLRPGPARRDDPLRGQGQPGPRGAHAAQRPRLVVRRGLAGRDRPLPGVGVDPARLSYGSTIKKERDIAWAYERGVRLFAIDSEAELRKVADVAPPVRPCSAASPATARRRLAPDAQVRLRPGAGARPAARRAPIAGLGVGVSFHVGSQQRDPEAWDRAARRRWPTSTRCLAANDIEPAVVNLGGGFPASYLEQVPDIATYGEAITGVVARAGWATAGPSG